jgi:hypothetical protein
MDSERDRQQDGYKLWRAIYTFKEAAVEYLRYEFSIRFEGLRKTTDFRNDNSHPERIGLTHTGYFPQKNSVTNCQRSDLLSPSVQTEYLSCVEIEQSLLLECR